MRELHRVQHYSSLLYRCYERNHNITLSFSRVLHMAISPAPHRIVAHLCRCALAVSLAELRVTEFVS